MTNKALTAILEKYELAKTAIREFEETHSDIFVAYDTMIKAVQEIETELKENVRTAGHGLEGNIFTVQFTPRRSVSYDYAKIALTATPKELKAIDSKAIIVIVDKTELGKLVRNGIVRPEVERAGFEERELTPAITIKAKELSND